MRRVRIPENNNNDPQAIFAVGIDQIVSDRISKSTIFDDQELRHRLNQCPSIEIFEDYDGLYLYHCHNLEHEDMGMMRNYYVRAA